MCASFVGWVHRLFTRECVWAHPIKRISAGVGHSVKMSARCPVLRAVFSKIYN